MALDSIASSRLPISSTAGRISMRAERSTLLGWFRFQEVSQMSTTLTRLRTAASATLGRCPRCMQQAFLAAVSSWLLVIGVALIGHDSRLTAAATIGALGLTLLWTAHLVAYAARSVAASKRPRHDGTADMSRRHFIPSFARAFGFIALATAFPAGAALAQGCCDCSQCTSDQVCCNTANGCCGCFPGSIQCPS
jgi:hypothetical protein